VGRADRTLGPPNLTLMPPIGSSIQNKKEKKENLYDGNPVSLASRGRRTTGNLAFDAP
jgi:hypothetical protein